jgi:hypothetical protein
MPIIYFDRLKSSVGINCFPQNEKSLEINGDPIDDFITETGTSGIWTYQKYASGVVELFGQASVNSASITWNAYLSTGLVYGNTRISYPFNIQNAVIDATLNYAGGSVGWVTTANALDDTQTSVTMLRNGNTGTMEINLHVKGNI